MKEKIIYAVVVIALFGILVFSISYAFFTADIIGGEEDTTMTIRSGRTGIIFEDKSDQVTARAIAPGWSMEKKFRVVSEATSNVFYNIVFTNVHNTFVNTEYLLFTLKEAEEGTVLASGAVPTAELTVLSYVLVAAEATNSYILEISYPPGDKNLIDDAGKEFNFAIKITEAT